MLPSGEIVAAWPTAAPTPRCSPPSSHPGGPSGRPRVISEDSPDQLEMDSNARGDVMVVWRDGPLGNIRTYFNLKPAGGSFAATGTPVTPDGQNSADPMVALDPLGNALVAWSRSPGVGQLYAAYRPAGGAFSAPDEIDPTDSDDPALAFEPNGDAAVVWQGAAAGEGVIRALRPAGAGSTFGAPAPISADTDGFGFPELTVDPAGNTIAAWTQPDGRRPTGCRLRVKPAAGDFPNGDVRLAGGRGSQDFTSVASDAQGNAFGPVGREQPRPGSSGVPPPAGTSVGRRSSRTAPAAVAPPRTTAPAARCSPGTRSADRRGGSGRSPALPAERLAAGSSPAPRVWT